MTVASLKAPEPDVMDQVKTTIDAQTPDQPGRNGTMKALAEGNPAALMNMFHQFTNSLGNSGLGSALRGLEPFLQNLITLLDKGMKEVAAASREFTVEGKGTMAAQLIEISGGNPASVRTLIDPVTGHSREAQVAQPQAPKPVAPASMAPGGLS